jgi:hypothetical protein
MYKDNCHMICVDSKTTSNQIQAIAREHSNPVIPTGLRENEERAKTTEAALNNALTISTFTSLPATPFNQGSNISAHQ